MWIASLLDVRATKVAYATDDELEESRDKVTKMALLNHPNFPKLVAVLFRVAGLVSACLRLRA